MLLSRYANKLDCCLANLFLSSDSLCLAASASAFNALLTVLVTLLEAF